MYWLEQQKQQKQTILRRAVLTAREVDPLAESVPLYRSVGKMYAFSSICVCMCRVSVCVCVCMCVCVCVSLCGVGQRFFFPRLIAFLVIVTQCCAT